MDELDGARARALTWGPKEIPVPYITPWSAERVAVARALTVRRDGTGLCYRDETAGDRDAHGVLWSRLVEAPGAGMPRFRAVHPVRQRRALLENLCQVCGGPASRTARGWLYLVAAADAAEVVEGMHCMKPPVCLPCATAPTLRAPSPSACASRARAGSSATSTSPAPPEG